MNGKIFLIHSNLITGRMVGNHERGGFITAKNVTRKKATAKYKNTLPTF